MINAFKNSKHKGLIIAMLLAIPAAPIFINLGEAATARREAEEIAQAQQAEQRQQQIAQRRAEQAEHERKTAWQASTHEFCMAAAKTAAYPYKADFGFLGAGDVVFWDGFKTVMVGFSTKNQFGAKRKFNIECKQLADGSHKVVEILRVS